MSISKQAQNDINLFQQARGEYRQQWVTQTLEDWKFYLGKQIDDDEEKALKDAGMPAWIINKITPAVELMLFFSTGGRARWQTIGRREDDIDVAHVGGVLSEYMWNISNGQQVLYNMCRDSIVRSKGYIELYFDPNADNGLGELKVRDINPWKVYVDPKSSDRFERDASYKVVRSIISKEQAMRLYPKFKNKIKKASGRSSFQDETIFDDFLNDAASIDEHLIQTTYNSQDGSVDTLLDHFRVYRLESHCYYMVTTKRKPEPEELRKIQEQVNEDYQFIVDEAEVRIKERQDELKEMVESGQILKERAELEIQKMRKDVKRQLFNLQETMFANAVEEASIVSQNIITEKEYETVKNTKSYKDSAVSAVKHFRNRCHLSITIGDVNVWQGFLPIDAIPLVPVSYTHTGTPYPQSGVAVAKGKQREINKAHQITIHNANISSNPGMMAPEGSFPNLKQYYQNITRPGGLVQYQIVGNQYPKEREIKPLSPAFSMLVDRGKEDLDNQMGIYMHMQGGVSGNQNETYRGMLAIDEFGTRRIKLFLQNSVEPALEMIGKLFLMWAKEAYPIQKTFRIVGPNDLGAMEEQETTVNVPIYSKDFNKVIGYHNNIRNFDYDIIFVSGSTMPVNRWALADEYFKYYQAGLTDDVATIAELDIKDKKGLLKRKSLYATQQNQIEQQADQITKLQEQNAALERQIRQQRIDLADKEHRLNLKDIEREQKAATRSQIEKEDLESKKIVDEMNKDMLNLNKDNGKEGQNATTE